MLPVTGCSSQCNCVFPPGIPAALQNELLVTKAGHSKGNELSGVTQAALLHKPLHRPGGGVLIELQNTL
ncbi:hypothetical protein AOLI_G00251620 [Acnodon oligacanthus]